MFQPLPLVLTDTFMMVTSLNYRMFDADINTGVLSGRFNLHSVRLPVQAGWISPSSPWVAKSRLTRPLIRGSSEPQSQPDRSPGGSCRSPRHAQQAAARCTRCQR